LVFALSIPVKNTYLNKSNNALYPRTHIFYFYLFICDLTEILISRNCNPQFSIH